MKKTFKIEKKKLHFVVTVKTPLFAISPSLTEKGTNKVSATFFCLCLKTSVAVSLPQAKAFPVPKSMFKITVTPGTSVKRSVEFVSKGPVLLWEREREKGGEKERKKRWEGESTLCKILASVSLRDISLRFSSLVFVWFCY